MLAGLTPPAAGQPLDFIVSGDGNYSEVTQQLLLSNENLVRYLNRGIVELSGDLDRLLGEEQFWQELDLLADGVTGEDEDIVVDIAGSSKAVVISITAGIVTWIMRAGVLVASVASSLPAWKGLDPLPILSHSKEDKKNSSKDEHKDVDEDTGEDVEYLFEDSNNVQSKKKGETQKAGIHHD